MKVKVYSTERCPNCQVLKKLLTSKGISFESVMVDSDVEALEEMVQATGSRTVPVTNIDGEWFVGMNNLEGIAMKLGI